VAKNYSRELFLIYFPISIISAPVGCSEGIIIIYPTDTEYLIKEMNLAVITL
jgi:hypothetical protein